MQIEEVLQRRALRQRFLPPKDGLQHIGLQVPLRAKVVLEVLLLCLVKDRVIQDLEIVLQSATRKDLINREAPALLVPVKEHALLEPLGYILVTRLRILDPLNIEVVLETDPFLPISNKWLISSEDRLLTL